MRKTLRIEVSRDGQVSVRVEGVHGVGCLDATKFLEDALGGQVQAREVMTDYYVAQDEQAQVTESGT